MALTIAIPLLSGSVGYRAAAAGPGPRAADDGVAAVIADYRSRIPELMDQQDIPGLALAVVDGKRDRVVWQEGFGVTDEGGSPVTVDTLFSVQSMSKVFTATAVMQAVQAGRLDLDEPITTYLPGFTVHSAFEPHPERRITLRMLLGHTAGFTHEAPVGNNYEPEPGTFDAHVRSISETWLRFPVGTGYAYSNLGIDLAGYILEKVTHRPFAVQLRNALLEPLGMDHSTFERAQVHAAGNRASGHEGGIVAPPVDVGMTAAGGLWSTAADLAQFLRFQLGNGVVDGRTVLAPDLMEEMRTIPAPHRGEHAGYALGIGLTHWRAGQYLDLFTHGGGGYGFLADLWFLPQLQLGIAVLTNSSTHDLQGTLALGILDDLVHAPQSRFHDRLLRLPTQPDVVEPDGRFAPPPDLSARIHALELPASRAQSQRWEQYVGLYRTGEPGAMDPTAPPSRFHLRSGVPYLDAAEDGSPVLHRLTEFGPGLFLAENGETLDLRGPSLRWRGLDLHRVDGGPLTVQWALLWVAAAVAAWWLLAGLAHGAASLLRRRRRSLSTTAGQGAVRVRGRGWHAATVAVAAAAAAAALVSVAGVAAVPGVVDVGFLGRLAFPPGVRLLLHLPLVLTVLTSGLLLLLAAGAVRRWWTPAVRRRDAVLAGTLTVLAVQLSMWHLVGWGL